MGEIKWPSDDSEPKRVFKAPVNTLAGWRQEIADCYVTMKEFTDMDAVVVFQSLSQFSARASEMRSNITSKEGREEANFRTRVIDPFIEECDRQFKIHSRITAINEMDARLAGGKYA